MRSLVALVAVAACGRPAPKVDVDPATPAQAKTFAGEVIAAAAPGCETKLEPLIDHDAVAAKVAEHTKTSGLQHDVIADVIRRRHSGVQVLCAWLGTDASFKLLSVVGARPLVRKLVQEAGKSAGVAYYAFDLGVGRGDGVVRLIDAYSYLEGAWLSEILGQVVDATLESGVTTALSLKDTMAEIKQLRAAHKGAEALAAFATLPEAIRKLRYMQMMRAGIARLVSQAEYLHALDDLARDFPDDPAVAMIEIDGAILHGDLDRALQLIDVVDKAVGGDPFQDAIRSAVYLQKHDLAQADAHADAAIAAEPTLQRGWVARLDVALARKDWTRALATIDELGRRGVAFTDASMRKARAFDGLVASPEYATWAKAHAIP